MGIDFTVPFYMLLAVEIVIFATMATVGFFILRKVVRTVKKRKTVRMDLTAPCEGRRGKAPAYA